MPWIRKLAWVTMLTAASVQLAAGQEVIGTIELPDGRTAPITFTTIDVSGAGATGVQGINNAGDMVGSYAATGDGPFHGFLLRNGTYTFFDYPGADSTIVGKINDAGAIVGQTHLPSGLYLGFSYDGATFTRIQVGKMPLTICDGINNAGYIVGGAGTSDARAFELRGTKAKTISFPGTYFFAYGTGINKFNEVAGWTTDGVHTHGFTYAHSLFRQIDFPGADMTEAWDINDDGVMVGWYSSGASLRAFVFRKGHFGSFAYPGAAGTSANAINAAGQIVGSYTFDFQTYHGFVTNPILQANLP